MTNDDGQIRDEPNPAPGETAARDGEATREVVSPGEHDSASADVSSGEGGARGEDASSGGGVAQSEHVAPREEAAAGPARAPAQPAAERDDALRLQPRLVPRADGLYYLSEILSYHDEAFVEAAFAAVLLRPPADEEFRRALADLRGGREKLDLLRDLARSAEGKAQAAFDRIAGLRQSRIAEFARGLPVVGHLWQILGAIVRLPVALRHQRQFEAYALAQQQRIADHINARSPGGDAFERVFAELRLAVADASAAVSLLSDALAETTARHAEQQTQLARRLETAEHLLTDHAKRLDAQHEFLVGEQRAIVEAQKAALASAEEGLRETADEQRRELAALSARVDELRAALAAARAPGGGKV